MSTTSRDQITRAHERIATLEGQLRELESPIQHTPGWAWVLLGMCLGPLGAMVLGVLGVCGWMLLTAPARERTLEPVPAPLSPAPAPKRTIGAQWYPQSDVTPILMDVTGDGQDDLVGLAWGGDATKRLLAVAFDGKTFAPLWAAGPFRGVWHSEVTHLLLVNGRIVVTDAAGDIHVIDRTTGKEERTIAYPAGVELACDAPKSDVLLVSSTRWGGHGPQAFDLATGAEVPIPKGRTCTYVDASKPAPATGVAATTSLDEKRFKIPNGMYVENEFDAGAVVLAAGHHDRTPAPRNGDRESEAYGVAWDAKTAKLLWQHSLIDATDVEHEQVRRHTLVADGSVIDVYQAKAEPRKGPFRVLAWNATTGEKQWSATLPSSAEGSWLGGVGAGGGRVYVVTNQGLHVLDGSSGAVLTTLESF